MSHDHIEIICHLLAALLAGAVIGLERSFHGRPAGFRTHALVCLASSLLMLITFYQWKWLPAVPVETVRADPHKNGPGHHDGYRFSRRRSHFQGRPQRARTDN